MPGMDIFTQDAFSLQSLTAAINQRPFVPSRLRDSGLFVPRGVSTTNISIELKDTTLSLVQTSKRGSAPEQRVRDGRTLRSLHVPRLAKEAVVYADQVQGLRAFGTESELEMVEQVVSQEVEAVATEIDLTEENLMLGAVSGTVKDADGSTIYNLYDEFGVSEPAAVSFALGTATTKVRNKVAEVKRAMAKALKIGTMPFELHAICGDEFFDKLTSHGDVKEAYERYQQGAMLREDLTYDVFPFAGCVFENYRGSDDEAVGIASNEARFYAKGVPGLFVVAYAPADTMETVNTIGLPRYVIPGQDPSGKDRFRSFEVQANVLPFCTRPLSLRKATA